MKLASVSTFVVQTPPPHSGGALWFFVKLETEDGLFGWGETAILAALHTLEDSYEKLVQQVAQQEGIIDMLRMQIAQMAQVRGDPHRRLAASQEDGPPKEASLKAS